LERANVVERPIPVEFLEPSFHARDGSVLIGIGWDHLPIRDACATPMLALTLCPEFVPAIRSEPATTPQSALTS
jgi:hypothetical protein